MRGKLLVLCFLSQFYLFGQNLIPNPGFDQITNCPDDQDQIALAFPWKSASSGGPELFNTCGAAATSGTLGVKVPNVGISIDSYQMPRSGNGFSGLFVYSQINNLINEFIETPLIEPLKSEVDYYIEFFVSPDLAASIFSFNQWIYTDAIGLAFSDEFVFDGNTEELLKMKPAIENAGMLITDTLGWTRVSGCYTAKGKEAFAIIGNFRGDEDTQVQVADPLLFPYNNYFYLEDVSIRAFDPFPDTLLVCQNESLILDATFLDAKFLWSTGSTAPSIEVNSTGFIEVEATLNDCILRDNVSIIFVNEEIQYDQEMVICKDESLQLQAPIHGTHQWSNGETSPVILINEPEQLFLTTSNSCGEFDFTFNIEVEDCDCPIYIPNCFSPNNDGINDIFEIYPACDFDFVIDKFTIFDRWGGTLHQTMNSQTINWDGRLASNNLANGIYTYILQYSFSKFGRRENKLLSGDILILK